MNSLHGEDENACGPVQADEERELVREESAYVRKGIKALLAIYLIGCYKSLWPIYTRVVPTIPTPLRFTPCIIPSLKVGAGPASCFESIGYNKGEGILQV